MDTLVKYVSASTICNPKNHKRSPSERSDHQIGFIFPNVSRWSFEEIEKNMVTKSIKMEMYLLLFKKMCFLHVLHLNFNTFTVLESVKKSPTKQIKTNVKKNISHNQKNWLVLNTFLVAHVQVI